MSADLLCSKTKSQSAEPLCSSRFVFCKEQAAGGCCYCFNDFNINLIKNLYLCCRSVQTQTCIETHTAPFELPFSQTYTHPGGEFNVPLKISKYSLVFVCVGPSRGWFQRSKVLQIQACLRMVMEWASRSGLGHLADKFFTKLNSTVSILATPPQQLTQVTHTGSLFLLLDII